jgi:hypothetical protein
VIIADTGIEMLYFHFKIQNLFVRSHEEWKSLYETERLITKNTILNVGVFRNVYSLFAIKVDTRIRGWDHAGPEFELTLFGYEFHLGFPDRRHWNYDKHRWYYPGESELEE